MGNQKSSPTGGGAQKSPPNGGPILDLIWESPPAGGISRDSPHRGDLPPPQKLGK